MPWHSTGRREELLLIMRGTVTLQHRSRSHRTRSKRLAAGQALFLPSGTEHQVVNRSRSRAHYAYVTG